MGGRWNYDMQIFRYKLIYLSARGRPFGLIVNQRGELINFLFFQLAKTNLRRQKHRE